MVSSQHTPEINQVNLAMALVVNERGAGHVLHTRLRSSDLKPVEWQRCQASLSYSPPGHALGIWYLAQAIGLETFEAD